METTLRSALLKNFLGQSPDWYKLTILIFLAINPLVFFFASPFIAGWLLVVEFIFTLAMALKCYPLLPGGLLALEAVAIGMTSPAQVSQEIEHNLEVLLLLIFMVAGIYFMKQLLLFVFTKLLLNIRSKTLLSLAFCLAAAFLSAFLDALTVVAVVISVATGFYSIYHNVTSNRPDGDIGDDSDFTGEERKQTLEQFRAFLRSLLMHAGVGTALGGVMTMVGEPQNLIIAKNAGWGFIDFFLRMAPVTLPVLVCGLLVCWLVERFRLFGYGAQLPGAVRDVRRFLSFAVVNSGAMGMALTYVSLAPNVLMGTAGLTPLQFSLVFGANGFWIMLVSFFANRIIHKVGRPVCLATGGILMGLGCLGLLLGVMLLPAAAQAHWLAYMLPVASACAGLAFVMGPATSYALEPYSNEAGVASALVGFVQMAGGAALGLVAMALPLQPKLSLALVMLAGCLLALHARRLSKQIKGQIKKVA